MTTKPGITRGKTCPKCGHDDWALTTQKTTQRWTNVDGTPKEATYTYSEKYRCRECARVQARKRYVPKPRKPGRWGTKGRVKAHIDETREARYAEQDGRCAICRQELEYKDAKLDHDHACCANRNYRCGQCSRGVLCSNCNTALGLFGDDIERMMTAIAYLAQWRQEEQSA